MKNIILTLMVQSVPPQLEEVMNLFEPFPDRIASVNEMFDQGHYIIFFTAKRWVDSVVTLTTDRKLRIL